MSLLWSRRLGPLLLAQMGSAFNDNLFKNALVVLIAIQAAGSGSPTLVAAAGAVFILPYLILSATAGQIADRFEKSRTIAWVKAMEVALMALAAASFLLHSLPLQFVVLFGLGVQATLFGPLKYGILPGLLREPELLAGNGLMEAATFVAILLGTLAGGALIALPGGPLAVAAAGVAVALAGLASALAVPRSPPSAPGLQIGRNPARETAALLRLARANHPVWLCLLGLSWFWAVGATVVAELPTLTLNEMHAETHVLTLMLAFFSVGVGAGSLLCSRLLHGEVTARHVPFAALGLSVFLIDFSFAIGHIAGLTTVGAVLGSPAGWRMLADLLLLAACGGLYSVPLYAIIQERAAVAERSRMIAANNVVNAVAIVAGAAVIAVLSAAGLHAAGILLAFGIANLAVAAWIVRLLPQTVLRAVFRWYFERLHGVDLHGLEHVRAAGDRAVVVVNHQSYLDGCFVASFLPGSPVFAVNSAVAQKWWARPFLAAVRVFPVDITNPFSTKAMIEAVRAGQTLVVFPEGRITVTGSLMKTYEGAAMVADKAGVPILVVRIDGLVRSRFSHMRGMLRQTWFPRLRLTVMPPIRLDAPSELHGHDRREAIGLTLQTMMEQAAFRSAVTDQSLFGALVEARQRYGRKTPIIEDLARTPIDYDRLLVGAAVLGRRLAMLAPQGGAVGVMLPNASGAVVTLFALQAFGRVPAMLNYSAGPDGMLAACTAAGVSTVLSSRAFIEKGKLADTVARMAGSVRFVWLEDLRAEFGLRAKARGWLDARRPARLPGARLAPDSPAAILFTSGSEGTPKGVVLSHRNILANIAQAEAVIDFTSRDRVFNAMPMFHSIGLTAATLLPVLRGVPTFFYPSPLHYRVVPELIYDTGATITFGTDTFLTGWARYAHPYDFYALRFIVAGAERVRPETRKLYAEKFGVRILEGYGVTETSPVLALNTPMHNQTGTAGRLMPGMAYRLDPVEGIETGGRLVVRGPNVMLGYLRTERPGVLEAPTDGWYDTGDICTVDAEGFVTIRGRAKRFAKIAGEMVSMPAAETLAYAVWPDASHAVVAIPDPRKGEALVLLTTQPGAGSAALLAEARARGTPEIQVARMVRVVDAVPLLGSGKVDYPSATKMAVAPGVAEAAE